MSLLRVYKSHYATVGLAFLIYGSLTACGGGSSGGSTPTATPTAVPTSTPTPTPTSTPTPTPTVSPTLSPIIKLNQLGFLTSSNKYAVVPENDASTFQVINVADDSVALQGDLSASAYWNASEENVKIADFSSLQTPGSYRVSVEGAMDSYEFDIADDVLSDVHDAAVKAYYFNRASIALEAQYAGDWARAAGHPDTSVRLFAAAATAERPQDTTILSAPKGWYDAGDYNKYIVNSGISTYTLMAAYEHFPNFYQTRTFNIPESGDNVPDILNEVFWNLEWMEQMQDTDGGVYHKLTTENFSGAVMPAQATAQRYMEAKSTSAALNFAAVMAVASRVYANFESDFPGKAAAYRSAAISAWDWAVANPTVYFSNTQSNTGQYGDSNVNDEFAWAGAELYLLTSEAQYLNEFTQRASFSIPAWPQVAALGYFSLLEHGENMLSTEQYESVQNAITGAADQLLTTYDASPYRITMERNNFNWGSNSGALNHGFVAYQAYRITQDERYLNVAIASADYVLGRNATGYSFVTGFGENAARNPHHRQSEADNVSDPVPGFVVGGPNSGQQDNCNYASDLPALSYVDTWCSYASNEVTINWNAPLVYVLAAIQQ